PSVRLLREDCSVVHGGMNGAGHINLFHPTALRTLLVRTGFSVLDMDGCFSDNPFEIAAHFAGATRGAYDMVVRRREYFDLPQRVQSLFDAIWPVMTQLERLTLSAPMLRVIACRVRDEARFTGAVATMRQDRRRRFERQLGELAPSHDVREESFASEAGP